VADELSSGGIRGYNLGSKTLERARYPLKPKAVVGKRLIGLALVVGLCVALAGPADAGGGFGVGGFGGGGRGGFHGSSGGFHSGHRGFHGGRGHVGRFHHASGVRFRACNGNGACVAGFSVGSILPGSDYSQPYPYPEDATLLDVPSPALQPRTETVLSTVQREACSPEGCYRLQGDGVTVPYQWAWVPAPPPPPPPPAVLRYPNGRYEQRGDGISAPSLWVWIPDAPTAPPPTAPADRPAPRVPGPVAPVPSQFGQLYRWVDDQGTVHWTQGLDAVPERYRPRPAPGTAG
jgi:hypothetical protein